MQRTVPGRRRAAFLASLTALALGLSACQDESESIHESDLALSAGARLGKRLFEQAPDDSNGRACSTCHVPDEGFTLRPASVAARLANTPSDPLFQALDADDPAAETLQFEALKKGLVRVVLKLPDNMDVIDADGSVITNADRSIFVWRAVPSVADVALSAPYQLDGREATLQSQAQSAITSHGQGPLLPAWKLDALAAFQERTFSSSRARFASALLASGVREEAMPDPEAFMQLSAEEQRGREVYGLACKGCHGGASTGRIENRALHTALSVALTPEGNVRFAPDATGAPRPVHVERPGVEFMNAGFGAATYVGQIGIAPSFNASIPLPRYRFRFYADATRSKPLVDLPPKPVTQSGSPFDLRPQLDANGAPIVGPNLIPQAFTTDPGRAAITGDPADFEAFEVPQLRGIAHTAPYFHDNSRETLRDVVDEYSRFLLPFLEPLALPTHPPEQPGGRPEALSPQQKTDLLEFLKRL